MRRRQSEEQRDDHSKMNQHAIAIGFAAGGGGGGTFWYFGIFVSLTISDFWLRLQNAL